MMKRYTVWIIALLSLVVPAGGAEFSSNYANASSVSGDPDSPFFYDENTGLTAFPTLLIPYGGKFEAMGTAFTAAAIDSGYLESNPAASSLLNQTELTFSHNNWIADTNLDTLLFTMRFDHLGIGAGAKFLYVPFTAYNDWGERLSSGHYSEIIGTFNVSYNFLPSYAVSGLAIGINAKFGIRNMPLPSGYNSSVSRTEFTGMFDFGLLTQFDLLKYYDSRKKNFALGLTLKNLGPAVGGHPSKGGDPLPTEFSVGMAYAPVKPLLLTFDFNYPFSLYPDVPAAKWNLAAGMDLTVAEFFSLQVGFRHRGGNPRFSLGSEINLTWVDININYTLDLTTQFHTPDRLSVEASVNLGDEGRQETQNEIDRLYLAGLEAYALGNLQQAISLWEQALSLDNQFIPVKEFLQSAQQSLLLQAKMEELYTVD